MTIPFLLSSTEGPWPQQSGGELFYWVSRRTRTVCFVWWPGSGVVSQNDLNNMEHTTSTASAAIHGSTNPLLPRAVSFEVSIFHCGRKEASRWRSWRGARAWYQCLRGFLSHSLEFEFCSGQPCIARSKECTIIIHVDDIMYAGNKGFSWNAWVKSFPSHIHSRMVLVQASVAHEKKGNRNGWLVNANSWNNITNMIYVSTFEDVGTEEF